MKQTRYAIIKFVLLAASAGAASSASAATLDFDCDAVPNHTSSVTQIVSGPGVVVSGRISIVEKRSGRFLPLAGVLIMPEGSGPDGDFVGFQISATRDGKATSDVTFRDHKDSDAIKKVSTVEDGGEKQFGLSLTSNGNMTLALAGKDYTIDVPRTTEWSNVRVMALCSTGQFKFLGFDASKQVSEVRK